MFKPKYTVTNKLLSNFAKIHSLVGEFNTRRIPDTVSERLEKEANFLSVHSSTSIEGNPLSLTAVKETLKQRKGNIKDTEREVVNYNKALSYLRIELEKENFDFDLAFIFELHKKTTAGLLPGFQTGKIRKHPVIINDPRSREVIFIPPDYKDVGKLLSELIEFVQKSRRETDPIITAGIFHKQFVLIHPFMDGNGRVARLATQSLLADLGVNTFNLFSFENYYNRNVTSYFKFVGEAGDYYEVKDGINFTGWLEYFTDGIVDELLRVKNVLAEETKAINLPGHYRKIIDHLEKNGSINDQTYSRLVERAKATRVIDFNRLIELGLIERRGKGKNTYYVLRE